MTGSSSTRWRVVGVPGGDPGIFAAELAYFGVELTVESTEPAVVNAIEAAAESAGVELERLEAGT